MPVVRFDVGDLQAQLPHRPTPKELREVIPQLGADLDDTGGSAWAVEFFPDRPDLFTVEGIARALRTFEDPSLAPATYDVAEPTTTLRVEPGLEAIRPVIGAAVLRDVPLTPARLEGLIDLQEDLHWGLGARRRKVAIGIHDLAPIEPPYVYRAADPHEVRFVPLQMDGEMDLQQVLDEHPKGLEYGPLLQDHDRYPVIEDAAGELLSFPPIINGVLTEVTPGADELFVDVTGTDPWAVEKALHIVVTSLAEAGARVEAVALDGGHVDRTPDLAPASRSLDVADVDDLLGLGLDAGDVARNLRRLGHGAAPGADGTVDVEVPAYRVDVLHDVDLVEDVAIGHGYMDVPSARPREVTYGTELPRQRVAERVRASLAGLGFLEVMTLSLSHEGHEFDALGRDEPAPVRLLNPVSEEHTILRTRLLPSLLAVLQENTHRDLPQRLFEVGDVLERDGDAVVQRTHVAAVGLAPKVGFTDVKGWLQALVRDLDLDHDLGAHDDPAFVGGRCARVHLEGEAAGVLGEVHPRTLEAFDLGHPAVALEIELPTSAGPR